MIGEDLESWDFLHRVRRRLGFLSFLRRTSFKYRSCLCTG